MCVSVGECECVMGVCGGDGGESRLKEAAAEKNLRF